MVVKRGRTDRPRPGWMVTVDWHVAAPRMKKPNAVPLNRFVHPHPVHCPGFVVYHFIGVAKLTAPHSSFLSLHARNNAPVAILH